MLRGHRGIPQSRFPGSSPTGIRTSNAGPVGRIPDAAPGLGVLEERAASPAWAPRLPLVAVGPQTLHFAVPRPELAARAQ